MAEKQQTGSSNEIVTFFVDMEKRLLEKWYSEGIVQKYLQKNNDSNKCFSFQDGPITANNPMGVHHAWGRTYKDLWQRFHNLLGYRQRFQNGFDCQGLWVEVEVEKELGLKTKKDIENLVPGDRFASIAKFVQLCKDRVHKYAAIQTDQSKRLGYFMDWDHSYFTMSEENNFMIWHFLKTCHENGWIYKGHESVPWCPRCETAISQHEMLTEDYKVVVHKAIYFELPIVGRKNEYLLVWTTTPWTLPANIAVAVDKKIEYSLVEGMSGNSFWLAKDLVESVFKKNYKKIIKTVNGSELVGLHYQGPFDELEVVKKAAKTHPDHFHTVIATDDTIMPISTTEGTGLVHTAVSAGTEDFRLGKKYGLPMIPVIADNADYLDTLDFLAGKNAKKHPEIIFDYLKEREQKGENWIFEIHNYKHRYPGCWRCKAELVWKVADEWYIAMDSKPVNNEKAKGNKTDERTLRERMIEVAKKIKWMPEFGLDRELDWLKNMHDWLISKKNRYWGLALPIYECQTCGTFEVLGSREELKKRAVEGWDTFEGHTPHKPHIDKVKIACSKCNSTLSRTEDVGNPWLDAGIVPYSTITKHNEGAPLYLTDREEWKKWFPVDFITESFPGQFKNWFYAMIAMSTVLEDAPPFQHVLGFGTLLGEDGRPMHKSWGNSIAFHEGADQIGVDVMRWMYCRHNPAENLLFGYTRASEVRRLFYLPLWNSFKFVRDYALADGYALKEIDFPAVTHVLDIWLRERMMCVEQEVESSLRTYDVKTASLTLETFVQDVSTWYIRRSRDRVGPSAEDKKDKDAFYDLMSWVLVRLSIILSPMLPFLSDEIYTHITSKESVHLAQWPAQHTVSADEGVIADMQIVRLIAEGGNRRRKEIKMKLRQPLPCIIITSNNERLFQSASLRPQYEELLKSELNVKKIRYELDKKSEAIQVEYDATLTPELILEGEVRDLIRTIQQQRKSMGAQMSDTVSLTMPERFDSYRSFIQKQVNASQVSLGTELKVELSI